MRPTMMPRRQTLSNASAPSKPPILSRTTTATTSTGQIPVSKFASCFQAILKGTEKPAPYNAADPERFYFDLFCLGVDKPYLLSLASEIPENLLVESGPIKDNIRELFFYAVKCIKTSDMDDPRPPNVIEILHTCLESFLGRELPNYSYDIMNLLAGSLEQADVVFPDFVTGLDGILQNSEAAPSLKERTLALSLLFVASINQGSVNSYFLRRDLFSSVIKLVSDPKTAHMAVDSFLMLGILANYHKYEARNAMLVRFEDLVDEGIMKRVREAASLSLIKTRDAYVLVADDSPVSFVANVASLVSSFRLLASPSKGATANGTNAPNSKDENAYSDLPLELVAILLPIYDLVNSNKAFSSFLLHDKPSEESSEPEFIPILLSFTSYLCTHAAVAPRSKAYSRLAFIIINLLVEEGAQLLMSADQACSVRICRQRQPALPVSSSSKCPPTCSILDCIVQYLRFNLVRKTFDVQTYLLVLRIAHKLMHQLKTARMRLDYDWQPLIQAIISLASFLVARQVELSDIVQIDDLTNQVLLTLDFAIVWADVILPDIDAISQLLYEVLRAEVTLAKLGALTSKVAASTPPVVPPSPRLGTSSPSIRRNSNSGLNTPKSPSLSASPFPPSMSPLEPTGPAADSIRNLAVVRSHFGGKIEDAREKNGNKAVNSQQILNIIKSSMDGLDLRESMALEEVGSRRYNESEHEAFFSELVPIVAKDILKLSAGH